MFRFLDILFSFLALVLLCPLIIVLVVILYFDVGSPIFRQVRVGMNKKPFKIIKFRTMHVGTPSQATHLSNINSITSLGFFLRKYNFDEIPQLWNVFVGDMSLVGPRPSLFSQKKLIHERDSRGVYSVLPGMTGLAQINNINMSTPQLLA